MTLIELQGWFESAFNRISKEIGFYSYGINESLHGERTELAHKKNFVLMIYTGLGVTENSGIWRKTWDLSFLVLRECAPENPAEANVAYQEAEAILLALITELQTADRDLCENINFAPPFEIAPTEKPFFSNAWGQIINLNVETVF